MQKLEIVQPIGSEVSRSWRNAHQMQNFH